MAITTLAAPTTITFNNHLDLMPVIDARSGGNYTLRAVQVQMDLGLGLFQNDPVTGSQVLDPVTGAPKPVLTTVWAYELVSSTGAVVNTGSMGGMGMGSAGTGVFNPTLLTRA